MALARLDTARARRSALKGDQGQARRLQQSARKRFEALGVIDMSAASLALEDPAPARSASDLQAQRAAKALARGPIFPVQPALLIKVQWFDDRTFSVSIASSAAEREPAAEVSFQNDPAFLESLGYSRIPGPAGAAPFEALEHLERSWKTVADGLTSLLFRPDDDGRLTSVLDDRAPRDVRLAIVDPGLTALPWEFVYSTRSDQRFLTVSQGMRRFYRTLDGPMPAALPLAWLRRALASLVDSGLRDDEPDGLRLRQAILSFQEREGLAEMGAADALTRWALDRSLRDSGGEPARLAIIVTLGDTSWYHPSPPQLLARLYQESDFDTLIVSDGVLSFELLKSELQGRRLAVIHVAAELNEAPSLGVHFNAAKDWRPSSRPDDGLITIRSLDAFLKSLPETELKPVVILSAILPSIRFEAVRQVSCAMPSPQSFFATGTPRSYSRPRSVKASR